MFEREILEFCITHKIKVQQYFFMWTLLHKDWNKPYRESLTKQYIHTVTKFDINDTEDLVDRGFIEDLNFPPNSLPEMYIVQDSIAKGMFADEEAGEELWKEYPPMFPLSTGGNFVSRAGGDKDELIALYLGKINNSPAKHKFVMQMLKAYKQLVRDGVINGHKISDFIKMELWYTVEEIVQRQSKQNQKGGTFGKTI